MLGSRPLDTTTHGNSSLRLIICAITLILWWSVCNSFAPVACGQEPTTTQISAEQLVENWNRLETYDDSHKSYRIVMRDDSTTSKKGTETHTFEMSVRRQPGYTLNHTVLPGIGSSVYCRSPNYRFILKKKQAEDPWLLMSFIEEAKSAKNPAENDRGPKSLYGTYPLSSFESQYTLAMAARMGLMKILKITPQPNSRSKIDIEWNPHPTFRATGTLVTDDRFYSVVFEAQLKARVTRGGDTEFTTSMRRIIVPGTSSNEIPVCQAIHTKETSSKVHIEKAYTFSNYSYDELPEAEFRLSHYGLPEPDGAEPVRHSLLYLWVVSGGGLFGLLALFFRWLARRTPTQPLLENNV